MSDIIFVKPRRSLQAELASAAGEGQRGLRRPSQDKKHHTLISVAILALCSNHSGSKHFHEKTVADTRCLHCYAGMDDFGGPSGDESSGAVGSGSEDRRSSGVVGSAESDNAEDAPPEAPRRRRRAREQRTQGLAVFLFVVCAASLLPRWGPPGHQRLRGFSLGNGRWLVGAGLGHWALQDASYDEESEYMESLSLKHTRADRLFGYVFYTVDTAVKLCNRIELLPWLLRSHDTRDSNDHKKYKPIRAEMADFQSRHF